MRRLIAMGLVLLAACQIDTTPEEKRWSALEGSTVYVASQYSDLVHANANCPDLQTSQGTVRTYKVKYGRLVDEQGLYAGSPREKMPLCNKCVR